MSYRAILAVALCIILFEGSWAQNKCMINCLGSSQGSWLPKMTGYPVMYGSRAEVQIGAQKSAMFFEEFYHITEKRGKLNIQVNNVSSTIVYVGGDNELFTVEDEQCTRTSLRVKPRFISDNGLRRFEHIDSVRTVYGPSAQLWRANAVMSRNIKTTAFGGFTKVRGIPVMYHLQCDPEEPSVLYRYYYVDNSKYKHPEGKMNKQMPLRVTAMDISNSCHDGPILQNTDFFTLSVLAASENDFKIPSGVGCRRRGESEYDIPDLSVRDLLYAGEIVYNDYVNPQKMITNFMMAREMNSQTMLLWANKWKKAGDDMATERQKKLYFVRSKTAIDLTTCAPSAEEYSGILQLPDGQRLSLSDPDIFLGSEGFYYLNTQVSLRGIPTLEFERVIDNLDLGNGKYEAIVTRHYLRDDVYSARNQVTQNAPFNYQIKLRNAKKEVVKEINVNVHSFVTILNNKEEIFGRSRCAVHEGTYSWIKVEFPIPEQEDRNELFSNLRDVGQQFVETVVTNTELTFSRISRTTVDTDMSNIYISAKILDKLPYLYDFDKTDGQTVSKADARFPFLTAEECAARCQEDKDDCNAFSLCGASCVLGFGDVKSKAVSNCTLYQRRVKDYREHTLRQVLGEIEALVKNEELSLVIPRKDNSRQPLQLKASVFSADVAKPSPINQFIRDQKFSGFKRGISYKPDATNVIGKQVLPLNQCKMYCLNTGTCESLSFCSSDKSCVLSSLHYSELPEGVTEKKPMCNIIGRSYLDRFTKNNGFVQVRQAEKIVLNATAQICARACVMETGFKCLSFEMCGDMCSMHATHQMDFSKEGKELKNKSCQHYSLDFKFEFRKIDKQMMKDTPDLVIPGVSAERCARSCVHNNAFTCREFDYCLDTSKGETTGRCMLSQKTAYSTKATGLCYRAIREVVNPEEFRYSQSLSLGLGFLFVAIGIALGVGIVFGIGYYQANKS